MTDISLSIAGTKYSGWETIRVSRSIDSLCGTFNFSLTDFPFEDTRQIQAGLAVTLQVGSTTLITGYIDAVSRVREGNRTELTFSGRDKTLDLVDCSAIYKSNVWRQAKLSQITNDLCEPFGVIVASVEGGDPKIKEFAIQTGESPFSAIERLCRAYGILPLTNNNGNILLTTIGSTEADVQLVVGKNIEKVTYSQDWSDRFSDYLIKGYIRGSGSGWLKDRVNLKGHSVDAGVDRYRPLVVVAERHMTQAEISTRAGWEAQVRMGKSESVNCTVMGWHQNPSLPPILSRIWEPNELVSIEDSSWDIRAQLVITSVTFEVTAQTGRTTSLVLNPPEIYANNPGDKVELSRRSKVVPRG